VAGQKQISRSTKEKREGNKTNDRWNVNKKKKKKRIKKKMTNF
jgi:hypothetical protein